MIKLPMLLAGMLCLGLFSGCLHEDGDGDGGVDGQFNCADDEDCPPDWHCIEGLCYSTECINDDTDNPGGGCPPGYYCDVDETCNQDCVTSEQCVEIHGMFWTCNEYGQCVYVGSGSEI